MHVAGEVFPGVHSVGPALAVDEANLVQDVRGVSVLEGLRAARSEWVYGGALRPLPRHRRVYHQQGE